MPQTPGQQPAPDPVAELNRALRSGGVYGALRFLNGRTRHRYTGAYLFEPPRLVNHCLFDRENPGIRCMGDLVLKDSYCGIVAEHRASFSTRNSLKDPRLDRHPARELMVAYHGYPMKDDSGQCFGSLCHWDTRPRLTPASEVPLMESAAVLLARAVLRNLAGLQADQPAASENRSRARENSRAP